MTRYVAFATKGIEDVAAAELGELLGLDPQALHLGPKHVLFETAGTPEEIAALARLTTVDDVCLLVAEAAEVSTADDLGRVLADLPDALARIASLRPVDETFSVTVTAALSPIGSAQEITAIAAGAVSEGLGWSMREGSRAPVDLRIFLNGVACLIGLRLFDAPLSDRAYRVDHHKGALRPTVAAAMVRLACPDGRPHQVWDPFCGSGTILAEAYRAGHGVSGSDVDPQAVTASITNLTTLDPELAGHVELADAASATTWRRHNTVDTVVANLPWGKQVGIQQSTAMYAQVGLGVAQLAARGGRACLLTTEPGKLAGAVSRVGPDLKVSRRRLGLLGQTPTLVTVER